LGDRAASCAINASAQDRDQWQSLVNAVMNLQVPYKAGNLTSQVTISFFRSIQFNVIG